MAILKTSLEEDLISRQERVVLRELVHAQQLAEGLKALKATTEIVSTATPRGDTGIERSLAVVQIEKYLTSRIASALNKIRIPNTPTVDDEKITIQQVDK